MSLPSLSSSAVFPSKAAGKVFPGGKEGKVTSDSVTLIQGFEVVRFVSRRRIKTFRTFRDRSSIYSCKENSGLSLLKLFSVLLNVMN